MSDIKTTRPRLAASIKRDDVQVECAMSPIGSLGIKLLAQLVTKQKMTAYKGDSPEAGIIGWK